MLATFDSAADAAVVQRCASRFSCRRITALPELLALRDHWDRLLAESAASTPWQSFDFASHWWQHLGSSLGKNLRLRIFVVERDGVPCLILPLQISRWPWLPGVPVYILEPLGSIMDVNRPRLALGRHDDDAYDCAFEAIWAARGEWHTIRIDEKLQDDAEVVALRKFAERQGLLFRQSFSHLCPYLDLDQTWEEFLSARGSKMRKNLRAAQRKLEALGTTSLRRFEGSEIGAGLDVLIDLHARSWKRRKKVEHSQSPAYRAFFRGWLSARGAAGKARVLALYCGEQPVAATIAFMDADTYYSAQIVHDAQFAACSPGTQLEALELQELLSQKRYRRYDFLGSFLNNKMRWTDTALSTTHVFVLRRLLRTYLITWYYFSLKPAVKPRLLALIRRLRGKS